ncbi:unnamed protein product, partial [Pocillopora meandrina]
MMKVLVEQIKQLQEQMQSFRHMFTFVQQQQSQIIMKSSITEPLPNRDVMDHRASVTYHLVEEGTKRERAMPIDSL